MIFPYTYTFIHTCLPYTNVSLYFRIHTCLYIHVYPIPYLTPGYDSELETRLAQITITYIELP